MIVISATFVAELLESPLACMLQELGLEQEIRFAPYHQLFQQLLTPGSELDGNRGGVNIALVRLEDFVRQQHDAGSACLAVTRIAGELGAALERFDARAKGTLLVCLLQPSPQVAAGLAAVIETAGAGLRVRLAGQDSIQMLTQPEIERVAGADRYDARRDELAHIPFSDGHFAALALALSRRIHAVLTPPAKVLVLDCDNTLWRGVVGEDGLEGIAMSAPYLALQEFALAQQRKGVLLCLASKNTEADVLDVLEKRSDCLLRAKDVVAHRINWLPKTVNLRALADELNLGLDAFVFMDDNPLECAQMRAALPQVVTLQVPAEDRLAQWLDHVWNFDKLATTEEDAGRTRMYQENAERRSQESGAADIAGFQAALELQVDIREPDEDEWARISQLTQRTNQFNFTTRRRSVAELKALSLEGAQVARVRASDRFGDYGLVGAMIVAPRGPILAVDTLLLSCRVLGRGVEHAMVRHAGACAQALGLDGIEMPLISTARNEPARAFASSVAAGSEASADGFLFRLSVAAALGVLHRPGEDPDAVLQARLGDERKGREPSAPPAALTARSERYARLAGVLVSDRALVHELALRKRQPRALGGPATPAASPVEQRLKALWSDVLAIDDLGVEDDYFALGGTSLQSVRLFAEIAKRFGVQLRLTAILAAPTVRTLARMIEADAGVARSGIVPLRTGSTENLFLVHDGLGETLLYLHLARRLPDSLSVFGIEPRRLPGIPLAHASMEEMAACYAAQVQAIQPHGPYHLGGMCAGGVIAYAMAAHLQRLGEVVETVAILDGATPQAAQRGGRVSGGRLARLRALVQGDGAQRATAPGRLSLAGAVARKLRNVVRYEFTAWLTRKSVQLRFHLLAALLRRERAWPRSVPGLSVAQIYGALDARYQPPVLADVRVLLVRASQGENADTPYRQIYRDDDFGWGRVAGLLTLADVAGGHASMLQEAHVDSLASVLAASLPVPAALPAGSFA